MNLFIDCHGDDIPIFCAYEFMRNYGCVLVVYDSFIQVARGAEYCGVATRRGEAQAAYARLSDPSMSVSFLSLRDDSEYAPEAIARGLAFRGAMDEVWAPAYEENGHDQHNLVAMAAMLAFPNAVMHRYTTYVRGKGKTRTAHEVIPEPWMIERKLRALACYRSQIQNPSTREWFISDLREYRAE